MLLVVVVLLHIFSDWDTEYDNIIKPAEAKELHYEQEVEINAYSWEDSGNYEPNHPEIDWSECKHTPGGHLIAKRRNE